MNRGIRDVSEQLETVREYLRESIREHAQDLDENNPRYVDILLP